MQNYWKNKKVLVTGHTGFKGSWLSLILHQLGSIVYGVSLTPEVLPNLSDTIEINKIIYKSDLSDITNPSIFDKIITEFSPEIIFHLASQSLVSVSYANPRHTYNTNIMGTINLLESIRKYNWQGTCIVITSDKCYKQSDYKSLTENDPLGAADPYSTSKACVELIIESYQKNIFNNKFAFSSARAGNVFGGGDWSKDRLVPDLIRSSFANQELYIRNPNHCRPWQYILDPLFGYMLLAEQNSKNINLNGPWNFGPTSDDKKSTLDIVNLFKNLNQKNINIQYQQNKFKETSFLNLDSSKSKTLLDWSPIISLDNAVEQTFEWYKHYYTNQATIIDKTLEQIDNYLSLRINNENTKAIA